MNSNSPVSIPAVRTSFLRSSMALAAFEVVQVWYTPTSIKSRIYSSAQVYLYSSSYTSDGMLWADLYLYFTHSCDYATVLTSEEPELNSQ